ncbi:MAG TPA: GNAT family N-acetyltransferase [Solirubrobacterales bacterium]|jgi:GNAT superfamily N-acetyltransferase|nr:GNAT family N-acetyltransferase [Solirubrobacterales bacterium]
MPDGPSDSPRPLAEGVEIRPAAAGEVEELLPLMRAYCDFYEVDPPDEGLLEMARALIADPEQGSLYVAGEDARLIGFAALGWKWASTRGARIGVMEDLFVDPAARGKGVADALIEVCAERCRERGAPVLEWVTAPDNRRAQAVYDRMGAEASSWLEYELEL